MTISQWNARTLLGTKATDRPERRTSLVAMELARYNINIAVLSETCFHASGSLYGVDIGVAKPNGKRREAGV